MRMSPRRTLEGELGQTIRQVIEGLLADEEFKESVDGELARISIHLQKRVWVSVSGQTMEGILEDLLPVYDSNKIIREWMMRVSALYFQDLMIWTGTISFLFWVLSKAGTFEQS